ncbi:acyl-CoA dehydrogenase [Rhodothalassium salexigens DSM 2132]|uniref:Acyl-CoA dehydrogenase n=1 Tax=Rhodothalassium salexigens DSM 2132 TaxID=1188247 RepID=A0A4R2PGU3_RHOSA|nr:acyl-CoA dehydrogenase family protein [Rhodothalassium salexigens]MBB4211860.1 acyl-CoA dehydrogenase [Rhodothalassium salexigens DSM 2132]MBK1638843.1 acyl-CoA dehydrogenase [Rhodothalassium salexigens DSM 2132]TCP33844.1 acyl-CoA dehydrogenase [Rhodothalassium salexigens DSM 2132]
MDDPRRQSAQPDYDAFAPLLDGPWYTDEHRAFRESVRRFVEAEISPHVDAWDEAGAFPRELYKKAGQMGLLALGYPEELGGVEADPFFALILQQEVARAGSGGVPASLFSSGISMPPVAHFARDAVRRTVVPQVLAGDKIAALAVTEPGGGSDVANLRTTARRDGDDYVINGEKTFISSGMRADYLTVAVRTGGEGAGGISLLLVDGDAPGLARTALKKMGWWCSDTATLYFDDVRVPVERLVGKENQGFHAAMVNFNGERLSLAALCNGFALVCLEEAVNYARQRHTFGRALITRQAIRHKLATMAQRIRATQAYIERTAWAMGEGRQPAADIALLKNQATETLEHCAREAVQIFGGAGYLRGAKVERIYREVRVMAIGGGAEEIMRDLAANQLGF